MGKNNIFSGILVLIVIVLIAASTFMVVTYTTGVLNAVVAFASTDQIAKLQSCGITTPAELSKLRAELPSLLPAMYVGFPILMIIVSILMFAGGYYYSSSKEVHSTSETTTTTSSPNVSNGRIEPGSRIEETRTQKSFKSEGK